MIQEDKQLLLQDLCGRLPYAMDNMEQQHYLANL